MNDLEKSRIDEITRLHGEIAGYIKITLDKAIQIGELLAEQKAELSHGTWEAWMVENLPFSKETAKRYVRAFQNRDRLKTARVTDLTAAYKLLEEPKSESGMEALSRETDRILSLENPDLDELLELRDRILEFGTERMAEYFAAISRANELAELKTRHRDFFMATTIVHQKLLDYGVTEEEIEAKRAEMEKQAPPKELTRVELEELYQTMIKPILNAHFCETRGDLAEIE